MPEEWGICANLGDASDFVFKLIWIVENPTEAEEVDNNLYKRLLERLSWDAIFENGRYDSLPEDKLRYDLAYIYNYSLMLDLRVFFLTFRVVFTGWGSR